MNSQNGHLYVVDDLHHLEDVKAGEKSWWCVTHSAEVGEHSAIYLIRKGIKVLFRTTSLAVASDTFCQEYWMATANIDVITLFDTPITAKTLRVNTVLKNLPALRRNFQGNSFPLPFEFFKEMQRIGAETHSDY